MEEKITKLLLSLGMAPCLKGFRACAYAIEMILQDPSALDLVTKRLYPDVAKRMGSTASRVERAIRTAVESMFEYRDTEEIIAILGLPTNLHKGKYVNSVFLGLCAMKLREG